MLVVAADVERDLDFRIKNLSLLRREILPGVEGEAVGAGGEFAGESPVGDSSVLIGLGLLPLIVQI